MSLFDEALELLIEKRVNEKVKKACKSVALALKERLSHITSITQYDYKNIMKTIDLLESLGKEQNET